ncbi:MAG: LytTR family DNA-binding domain-containing protein [Prolixibacteraceae bacterium]|jgi:DNA-binding LytR/AlgR family response regulator|nr:LytTR family DNA-binding domain-containing protein [Prolixibacteraceae bacterium]
MIRCVAIDDEPLALDIVCDFARRVPFLNLKGRFTSAFKAIEYLRDEEVDLIFLDIQMPDITGIEFLNSLENKPQIIFTTAYSEYALEGFNLRAADYLLKPFLFERFMQAVMRAKELIDARGKVQTGNPGYFFVKANYQLEKINFNDILFVEGLKDYLKIRKSDGTNVVAHKSMKTILEELPSDQFMRVHRSFIIALEKIDALGKNHVSIGKHKIPISEFYRDDFNKFLERNNIQM